jgi:cytochrome c oxidase cbb3-type subunit III
MTIDIKTDEAPLRPYEADGIQELDNNLPTWWVGVLISTTIFAVLYMFYVHGMEGTSIKKEYADSLLVKFEAQKSEGGEPTELNAMIGNKLSIEKGKEVFVANCVPCHGANGEGVIGPNLTDEFWLHGGQPDKIFATIMEGAVEKGMPPWGPVIGELKARLVTAYIASLKGSKPTNAKAAQGDHE